MPWQRQVADVGLELLEDGRPAYRGVGFTVPRQSGKTTLILGWEIQRAVGWTQMLGQPQRIAYSAQSGKDAREKLLDDQAPLIEAHKRLFGVSRITRANGSEQVVWKNGSRIVLLASSADSGHGKTIDLGVKDELFADTDFRRDQALIPAMATRAFGQVLTASTAGTGESVALNAEVAAGRLAVESGRDTGIAYFEWSAPEDADPEDPATWWRCMPALGRTIGLEVVEYAYSIMHLGEFKRAFLNIPTASVERVIPASLWAAICDRDVEAVGNVFALDVNPERSAAGIVAVGDGPIIEVVDYRAGTGWLVDRIADLQDKHPNARFVLDRSGPAGAFADELEAKKVPLVEMKPQDVVRAAGVFYDAAIEGRFKVRTDPDLDNAVAGAVKRDVGDAWTWGRKSSKTDISLLVASTIGLWTFLSPSDAEPELWASWG